MSAPSPSQSSDPVTPSRVARVLDVVCLGLLVLALVVAEWGGFRERVGGIRLALTSPYRLLIAAIVIGVIRHRVWPAAPIWRDLPARLGRRWRSDAARRALPAVVGTRVAILFIAYMAVVMIGFAPDAPPQRLDANEITNLQARWDAQWYFGIASSGYQIISSDPRDQQNVVFFPAYPLLLRVAARLLGGQTAAFMLAGTLLSCAAFFWALVYLFRLARELLGDDSNAHFALWLVAAYPFAWFFSALYTESLFLLGAVAAFYHFRHGQWLKAGAWGLLVGLCRPNGCFLSIPLGLLAVSPWLPAWVRGDARARAEDTPRPFVPALSAAAMPGIGVLLYSAYVWTLTGRPLAWAEGHLAWGREYRGLGAVIADRYAWLANDGLYAYSSQVPADLLNALGALFVLAAAWPVARRFGVAYAVFILVNVLPPMAAGGMLSIGRVSSVLFPAFIWFASVVPERHRSAWIAGFMAVQAFGASLFYTWRQLY